ncbi:ATP-binding cassette domain-containing protein [Anaerolineales bacterium HSG24]|nr:ATP-binding cassette domain-containing protein [Anaerolineales bacterium HSG24]
MIEAVNLAKEFGSFVAVRDISLQVEEGEVVALLGPNGAGKTTTVRMLSAILKPTRGYARVAGYDTVTDGKMVRHLIGVLTEFPGLYSRMRGINYLKFFGELQAMSADQIQQRSEKLLRRFELWDAHDRQIGKYSKGMKQKLTLVRAMLHDPNVLFLDEPTSAMDPQSAKLVRDSIMELRADKRTVILCTHNLNEAELLADRIAIVRQGEIVIEGTPAELKRRLLGHPLMELRTNNSINGIVGYLNEKTTVVEQGENWIRYTIAEPEQFNPTLLNELNRQQISVVTLSEIQRSLEDVYLSIVTHK